MSTESKISKKQKSFSKLKKRKKKYKRIKNKSNEGHNIVLNSSKLYIAKSFYLHYSTISITLFQMFSDNQFKDLLNTNEASTLPKDNFTGNLTERNNQSISENKSIKEICSEVNANNNLSINNEKIESEITTLSKIKDSTEKSHSNVSNKILTTDINAEILIKQFPEESIETNNADSHKTDFIGVYNFL